MGSSNARSGLILIGAICLSALLEGCGGKGSTSGGGNNTGLNLPAGHTLQWTTQIEKQGLTQQCPTATYCTPTNTAYSEAVDYQGNIVIAGQTNILFTQAPDPAWNYNGFVAKYSSTGSLLWIQQFGPESSTAYDLIDTVVTDAEGNIYAGGATAGAYTGYSNPYENLDLVLAKLDPSGNILWVRQYQTPYPLINIVDESMVLLPSGNIAFGWTCASTAGGSANETFFYVVDPVAGDVVWDRPYLGANEISSLTTDTSGNLIAAGVSRGEFPGIPSDTDIFPYVVKFNGSTGVPIWQQTFADYLNTTPSVIGFSQIAEDSAGNILLGGATTGPEGLLCQGLCNLPWITGQSALVAKLDGQTGKILWTKDFDTGKGDGITSISVDRNDNLLAVGFTNGLMANGFTQPTDDFFALKLDTDGTVIWAQQFGTGPWPIGGLPTTGIQAATDSSDNLYIAGETEDAFPGFSNPTNIGEVFVVKFGP